jgi:prevent-host-death family protein
MDQFNYAEIKETLPEVMEKVCHDHTRIIITRDNNTAVVLMSA